MYEIMLTSTPPIHMRFRLLHNDGGDPVMLKMFFQKPQRIDVFVGERFVSPNNIDLTSDAFAMLPADDSYIPSLESEVEGENYFDPTTGYLYLLLRGTEPVDYKIQPAVVTKVGASVDMDNFFEGDVAGNIAALLGIDPSNIRVTNVVREGKRKKRFAPTWDNSENIVLEMTIEPPPLTNLSETTTVSGTPTMNITELKNVVSALTNGFQDGSIGSALGINVTSMATNEPIYVPTPEDMVGLDCIPQDEDPEGECYFGPEDNAQTGVPWSEASQANATKRLEENLRETVLQQPTALRISVQPSQGFEMTPFSVQPEIYMVDQDNKYVSEVGTEFDPWVVTASISSGSGSLINNITCSFVGGMCIFENLAIDSMGDNYTLQFELTYP